MTLTSPQVWLLIAALAAMAVTTKALGPVLLGGRDLPPRVRGVIAMLAPALLAALVATSVLADGARWGVGAATAGVAAGVVALLLRAPLLLAAVVAVLVTAGLRALF